MATTTPGAAQAATDPNAAQAATAASADPNAGGAVDPTAGQGAELHVDPQAASAATNHQDPNAQAEPSGTEDVPPGLRKRFSELTRQRRMAEQRAAEAAEEARLAREALEQATRTSRPADEPLEAPEFHDPEQFARDMAEYNRRLVERTTRAVLDEQEQTRQQRSELQRQQEAGEAIRRTFQQNVEKARERHEDYDEVTMNPDVPISVPLAAAIAQHPDGAELAYELGKNPAEAARIHAMPPALQIVELGMLAYRLKNPAPAPSSRAPAPITPVRGGTSPAAKDPSEMSMEEYAAYRRKTA